MSNEIPGYEAYGQTIVVLNTLSVFAAAIVSGVRRGFIAGGLTFGACLLFGMAWLMVMGMLAVVLDRIPNRTPLSVLMGIKNIGLLVGPVALAFVLYPL